MKITITQGIYEEFLLNLILTYQNTLENSNTHDFDKFIYEFLINSSLLNNRLRNVLQNHLSGNFEKSYDSLMYQSDLANNLYDNLASHLIEIEYLELYSRFVYFQSFNAMDKDLERLRELFISKRNKVIKFFNINMPNIIQKIEKFDYTDVNLEIANSKNKIYSKIIENLVVNWE
jgi:hypothetical protein